MNPRSVRIWPLALLVIGAVTLAPPAAHAQGGGGLPPLSPPVRVQFALNWIPISEHMGVYVALEKGYWKDLGLNMEVSRGYGSTDSIKRVATNAVDVALADSTSLIIALSNDPSIPVKTFAIHYQKAPYNIVYVKGRKIREPKDLATAVHGGVPGASDTQFYAAFLRAVGLPPKAAGFVAMDAPAKVPALLLGKIDVIAAFMSTFYSTRRAAERAGIEIGYWLMADYGIDPYSLGLIAHEKTLRERPEVLKRFLKGWLDGWAYTSGNPEEAARIFKKHNPQTDQEGELLSLKGILPLIVPPATMEHGIGFMTRERWQNTADLTKRYMELKQVPAVDGLYTTEYFVKVRPLQTWK